jgi:hypothetical protein
LPPATNHGLSRQKELLRNHEIMVTGAQWPHCMYEGEVFDPNDAWKGLLRNEILVKVCRFPNKSRLSLISALQAFKFIFISPSSVNGDRCGTCAGNARIHGMTSVTKASIAYVAMQVNLCCNHRILSRLILTFLPAIGSIRPLIHSPLLPHRRRNRFGIVL